ncbi:MAG: hypothetical protein J0L63_02195 [Anaerolineae bacterium]|nr:hypothetical protein [Anaerolineae bacterium]
MTASRMGNRWLLFGFLFPLFLLTPTPDHFSQLIRDNVLANRPAQALYQIHALVLDQGWTADLALQAGDLAYASGDMQSAASYWEMALNLQPGNGTLTRRLSLHYLDMEYWSQAVRMLDQSVVLDADDNWAHFHLALLQLTINPSAAVTHFQLAARDARFTTVAEDLLPLLQAASAGEPQDMPRIGVILAGHNLWRYADYVLQFEVSLSPQPEAVAYLGLARDHLGKNSSGQFRTALELAPNNPRIHFIHGLHYRLLEDHLESLYAFQRAASLDPINPTYAAEVGLTYQRLGQSAEAEYWLKAALTLSANDNRFQSLLDAFYEQSPSLTPSN